MILATIYSFFTYVPGIFYLPWYFMIFKPLCPTYLGLFTIILMIYAFKKQFPKGFTELAFIIGISLGLISVVFYGLLLHHIGFNTYHFTNWLTHPLLVLLALALFPHLKKLKLHYYIIIATWLALDFFFLVRENLFGHFRDLTAFYFNFPIVIAMAFLLIFSFSLTLFIKQEN